MMRGCPDSLKLLSVFCLLFVFVAPALIQGASPGKPAGNEVLAIGSGSIVGENMAQAKDSAISQALTKGVESYLVQRLGSRGAVTRFPRLVAEVLPGARAAIENFVILAEDQAAEKVHILVKIRINEEVMEERLRAAGLILTDVPPVKILFLVSETRESGDTFWWGDPEAQSGLSQTEVALYNVFEKRGFNPINRTQYLPESDLHPDMKSAELQEAARVQWGKIFLADVVIYGRAEMSETGGVVLTLQAWDVGRGVEICSGEERADLRDGPGIEDPFMEGVSGLANRLAVRFSPVLIEAVASDLEQVAQLDLTLTGLSNYRELTVFRDFLRTEVTGVLSVRQTRVRLDAISLSVEFQGNANRFLNRVLNHENLPFPMEALQTEEGGLVLSVQ